MKRFILSLCLFVPAPAHAGDADALLARARKALAPIAGELKTPGLAASVEILRDKWGVPHIYAKNQHDLFFAQGFVAAQDRLFQLELWRRHAAGEMAELLGESAVESDRFARLIRYRGDMDAEWKSYAPDAKEIATAFTDGINACIDQFGDKLPIEFELLKFKPKRWRPEDVLARMSGVYMSQNFRNEVMRAKLVAAVGIEKARKLAPVALDHKYDSPLPLDDLKEIDRVLAGYNAAVKLLNFTPPKTESNNWVVSGKLSESGKPLLASDPHRALARRLRRILST
ncbi:MAG: penicillin acylase family protein [Gemmataceae bacterium]